MNIVDSYQFGLIVIDGKRYSSDVIIFPHRVKDGWWKKRGHQLCIEDIADVMTENPEVLVVGTGAYDLVKVLRKVRQAVDAHGIKLVEEATEKACNIYNQLCHSQKAVAAFHITC